MWWKGQVDENDLRILRVIQDKPDLTVREVAEQVGMSHTPCWRRLQQLHKTGVIQGKRFILDAEALGYEITVFCFVRMKEHRRAILDDFERAVQKVPEVLFCSSMTGDFDYILRVVAKSVKHYEETIKNSLVELPHVQSLSTSLALKEVKNTTVIPI